MPTTASQGLHTKLVTRASVVVAVACALAIAALGITFAIGSASAAKAHPGSTSRQPLKCQLEKKVCNKAAWRALPLRGPDRPGTQLLSEAAAIAKLPWQVGDMVGAIETTYGQAKQQFPGLAASTFINHGRKFWIVTIYLGKPVHDNSLDLAPGAKAPVVSVATVMIDAATGTETNWCTGCATIPASGSATALARTGH